MDYGNSEDIKLENVLPLHSNFRNLPFQVHIDIEWLCEYIHLVCFVQAIHCSISTADKDSFTDSVSIVIGNVVR